MSTRLAQLRDLHLADPNDPFLIYGIALEHAKAGDAEEALAWLERTLQVDETYAYAYFQKGKLLSELGRDEEARQALSAGIQHARTTGDNHAASELTVLLDAIE